MESRHNRRGSNHNNSQGYLEASGSANIKFADHETDADKIILGGKSVKDSNNSFLPNIDEGKHSGKSDAAMQMFNEMDGSDLRLDKSNKLIPQHQDMAM